MNHRQRTISIVFTLFSIAIFLGACTSNSKARKPAGEDIITRGIEAWNSQGPDAAHPLWVQIEDEAVRNDWLSNIERIAVMERELSSVEALAVSKEAQKRAAFKRALATAGTLDSRLKLPEGLKGKGQGLAEGRIEALVLQDAFAEARSLAAESEKVFGAGPKSRSLLVEAAAIEKARSQAMEAGKLAAQAKERTVFDERISGYNEAIAAWVQAEDTLAASSREFLAGNAARAAAKDLKRQRQDLEIRRDTEIREKVYAFKDRIGEVFAEAPQNPKGGIMGLEELLAHQERVKENINAVYSEMTVFAGQYPESIDREILEEVDLQKRDLELKIIQVNNELKTAKEIASRGKVVMPVMIGLFNPEPDRNGESKKSRPARFSAKKVKKDEYWWGMISIPRGVMNDLVVTLKDNRTVRVFSENTHSGKLIKNNSVTDLVNRSYKIGNSWPVLNAGSQLASNKYFFEVQEGKTPEYEGEVVVYSSFVVRMR